MFSYPEHLKQLTPASVETQVSIAIVDVYVRRAMMRELACPIDISDIDSVTSRLKHAIRDAVNDASL